MQTQHTPGDWHVESHDHFYKVCDEQGVTIADIPIQPLDPQEWAEANARLIAGAPALLDAALLVIDRWTHGDLAEAVRILNAAAATATGGGT
jgi:hypothetical protein